MYYNRNLITASEQAVTRADASGVFDLQTQAVSQNEKDWPGSETASIIYDLVLGPDYLTITIQSAGTVNYTIDWGDGTVESSTSNTPSHTYSSSGSYKVKIFSAGVYRPHLNDHESTKQTVSGVEITENANLGTTLERAFYGCRGLATFKCPFSVTSSVTSLNNMFGNTKLLPSVDLFDTSNVTNFSNMFFGSAVKSLPAFDSSSAIFFGSMFRITTPIELPNLDVSNIQSFAATWRQCAIASFPSFYDFSSAITFAEAWRSSAIENFPANMFDSTGTLTANAFRNAFNSGRLTAQSIENILTSLVTNGATGAELHIGGGQNANYSTWSQTAKDAFATLSGDPNDSSDTGRGWTITYNTSSGTATNP